MTSPGPSSGPNPRRTTRRLAAIGFADLVGYTRISAQDERAALALVGLLQECTHEAVGRFGGKVVKFIGDAAMTEFPSSEAAVLAACSIRDAFHRNDLTHAHGSGLRLGIHVGDVVTAPDGDLYGDGVNVAARVQAEASAGQLLVSGDVARQLRQRPEFSFTSAGPRTLKGIAEPLELFQVDVAAEAFEEWDPPERPVAMRATADSTESEITLPQPEATHPNGGSGPSMAWRWLGGAAMGGALLLLGGVLLSPDTLPPMPAAAEELSIAVLPFADLSPDQEQAYFSDGMMEDVLLQLSRIADLRVVSRTSVMPYRGSTRSLPEIAAELGVGHILEGSVRRVGDQLRVTAQLVDARVDRQIWGETYDRSVTDVFAIQSDIATRIARELAARLTPAEEQLILETPTENVAAYELYLQARELGHRYTPADNERSIALFQRAITLDPDFALAHAGLADAFTLHTANYGQGRVWADSGLVAAQRAVELDPQLPEARKALGTAYLARGWNRAGSAELERALELSPSYASAMGNLGLTRLIMGRLDEAERIYRRFMALDPVGGGYLLALGNLADVHLILESYGEVEVLLTELFSHAPQHRDGMERATLLAVFRREQSRALERVETILAHYPDDARALLGAGNALLMLGEPEFAREHLERSYQEAPTLILMGRYSAPILAVARRLTGDTAGAESLARAFLEESDLLLAQGVESFALGHSRAAAQALLGETDGAMETLESAVREGTAAVPVLELDPLLEPIRQHPRFPALVELVRERNAGMRAQVLARLEGERAG